MPYVGTGNAQCIYWDEALPGFGVRVFPNGRASFVCSYRVQGRKRLATLGRADVLTLDAARRKARSYLGQVADGADPQSEADAIRASGTVKDLVDAYLERHAKAKKRSWRNDVSYLERHVLPRIGTRLAASITSPDIARLHSELGEKHRYTANRVVEVVRKMYNVARTWGTVPQDMPNPAAGIEDFPEQKRRRYVTPAEMPRLAAAIADESRDNPYAGHALWLLLLTGLRRGELLRAKWSDIDWQARTLYVGTTKNGEPVLAPLSRAAITRLREIPRLDDNPHIICGSLPGKGVVDLKGPWGRIRKAAGLEDVRVHDLRRTVGSWLVRNGASLHLVGAVLNHKDQKTTAGYAYFQTQDRTRALDRHGHRVLRASAKRPPDSQADEPGVLAPSGGIDRRSCRLEREELYRLVWSEPVSQIAARLGVSDVGLAKACRRMSIPLPKRGYWSKVGGGKPSQRESLPPATQYTLSSINIKVRRRSKLAPHSPAVESSLTAPVAVDSVAAAA